MELEIELPGDVAQLLNEVAAARSLSRERIALEAITWFVPPLAERLRKGERIHFPDEGGGGGE